MIEDVTSCTGIDEVVNFITSLSKALDIDTIRVNLLSCFIRLKYLRPRLRMNSCSPWIPLKGCFISDAMRKLITNFAIP